VNAPDSFFLAIDTSGAEAGLVLSGAGRTDFALLETGPSGSARTEDLADVAGVLMARAGTRPADLSFVAAVVGPGSYTGLRSGLAFLRGLSFDGATEAVGVGSLELLAWRAGRAGESVIAVSDAGAGRYAVARYSVGETDVVEDVAPAVIDAAASADYLRDHPSSIAAVAAPDSPSATTFADAADACGVPVRRAGRRSLECLAELAASRRKNGNVVRVSDLLPLYVGEARAKPNRHRVAVLETPE
jgi:tRNA threonylcarbamoyl adenosine modification protein YeaZ